MLFSTVGAPICIPTNSVQEFQLFTSSPTCVIYGLFDDNHSDRCGVLSHCAFDLHFMSLPFWIQSIFSVQCVSRLCLYWTLDTLKDFVPRRILQKAEDFKVGKREGKIDRLVSVRDSSQVNYCECSLLVCILLILRKIKSEKPARCEKILRADPFLVCRIKNDVCFLIITLRFIFRQ